MTPQAPIPRPLAALLAGILAGIVVGAAEALVSGDVAAPVGWWLLR